MGLLLDIDGTLLDAGCPIEGAAAAIETLRARGIPLLFATNTSRKSRAEVAASLREAGIAAEDDEILSAGYAAAVLLKQGGVHRVHLLLAPGAAADYGDFEVTETEPEAVVVGDMGDGFTFDVLDSAFRSLHAGARLVATQKNRSWKSPRGWTLDAGPFVAALEYAAGVEAEVIGKPSPGFFRMAASLLGERTGAMSIVGDDLESDVAGGLATGMTTYLVRTGKFDAQRLAAVPADRAPHHVLESIRSLPDHFR